jgi:hypothetical protein
VGQRLHSLQLLVGPLPLLRSNAVTLMLILIPAILSLLALGAHFLRMGSLPLALLCLVVIGLALTPRRWAVRGVQVVLALGVVEWAFTLLGFVAGRQQQGRPFLRGAIIIAAVGALAGVSAWLLQKRVRRLRPPQASPVEA